MTIKQRLEPFLVLLEARYLPLMFLALPQAYAVSIWLNDSNAGKWGAIVFSVIGAMAFEGSYVGAIAWSERQSNRFWFWVTALAALAFSVLVSVKVYQAEGWWSLLHAGFPAVAFGYTMLMHYSQPKEVSQETIAPPPAAQQPDYSDQFTAIANMIARLETRLTALETIPAPPPDPVQSGTPAADGGGDDEALPPVLAGVKADNDRFTDFTHRYKAGEFEGLSQVDMAAKYGVSRVTVNGWVKKVKQN
jgi:hypothetical protein